NASWRSPGFTQTDNDPVVCVNWLDSREYVTWLSQLTGRHYRLLSEAEWEYAARAGRTTAYYTGPSITTGQANFDNAFGRTLPVGSYAANRFGLYDMAGNVWQWVEDCYEDSYEGHPNDGAPYEKSGCSERVLRGGSWFNNPRDLRSAIRADTSAT